MNKIDVIGWLFALCASMIGVLVSMYEMLGYVPDLVMALYTISLPIFLYSISIVYNRMK
jgi:hypothetical protein